MSQYVRFPDSGVLVEVSAAPSGSDGLVETGLGDRVATAAAGLREALEQAISASGGALIAAAQAIEPPPEEIEVTFGVDATGELGNVVVGKGTARANFTVRLTWRRPRPG